MFFPRIGQQVHQIGLTRPCLRFRFQSLDTTFPSCFRHGIQASTLKPGVGQRTWRTVYARRAFGSSAIVSIGLGVSAFARPKALCEAPPLGVAPNLEKESCGPIDHKEYPPPPQSSLSTFELTFGAVMGICAGVFVKKGAKAVAWLLGGVFVLLQFLGSKSLIKVDWSKVSSRFENLFYTRDAVGNAQPPNVLSLWRWLIDFLTADFQPRASFIAGFALGLRIG